MAQRLPTRPDQVNAAGGTAIATEHDLPRVDIADRKVLAALQTDLYGRAFRDELHVRPFGRRCFEPAIDDSSISGRHVGRSQGEGLAFGDERLA